LEATNESPSKLLEKTKKPFLSTFISIFAMSVQVFVAGLTIGILDDPHHLIVFKQIDLNLDFNDCNFNS
jgi:hypothetical protein